MGTDDVLVLIASREAKHDLEKFPDSPRVEEALRFVDNDGLRLPGGEDNVQDRHDLTDAGPTFR